MAQTASRRQLSARSTLIVAQMALAVVLLAAAGLMLRSFQRLRSVQPGLDASGLLTFEVSLPWARYGVRSPGPDAYLPVFRYHRELATRLAALPGVTSVAMTRQLAIKDGDGCALVFAKDKSYTRETAPCLGNVIVGPGYFSTLGIAVHGREPTWADVGEQDRRGRRQQSARRTTVARRGRPWKADQTERRFGSVVSRCWRHR